MPPDDATGFPDYLLYTPEQAGVGGAIGGEM
jgi:hypothetical protein